MFCRLAFEKASDSFEYGIIYLTWPQISEQTILNAFIRYVTISKLYYFPSVRPNAGCVLCMCVQCAMYMLYEFCELQTTDCIVVCR